MDPLSVEGWIMFRIGYYRFAFIWISVSCYFSYRLKTSIFDSEKKSGYHAFIVIIGILNSIFSLAVPSNTDALLWDLAAFGLAFIYVFIIYLEFIIKSYKLYNHIEKTDKTYRNAIRSLVIMGFCFILTLMFYVADRVWYLFMETSYSVFYYLADVSILIGIVFAYFGYVKPKV